MQQNDLIKEKLDEYFKIEEESEEKIFAQLALLVYRINSPDSDLHILAKILPEKYTNILINYFNGDTLKLPTKKEYMECILTAVCFYLKVLKNYSWVEIKEFLDLSENNKNLLSSISIGGRINKIHDKLSKELLKSMKNLKVESVREFIDDLKKRQSK